MLPSVARARVAQAREHVVVVGAGAFGGWTALALLRAGVRVTLIDAWGAGHSRSSSGGETRVIRGVYGGEPIYSRMAARAFALWTEEERRWQRQVLFPIGAIWMFAGDDSFARRSVEPMKAVGLPVEELSPVDAARRYPQMNFSDVRSVFVEPRAGFLLARLACELVRETFVREGGDFRIGAVRTPSISGGQVSRVTLEDGATVEGDSFVFACGPWMRDVFPFVIGRRIVATRQEVFFFGTPSGNTRFDAGTLPAWVHMGERVVYGVPGNDRRGMKVADDTAGVEVNPTTMDRVPSAAGMARARRILRQRFPGLAGAPLVEARVCQYEASASGNFLIDQLPGAANVWLVGGGSGHGFKMGPALGEHVAELVLGRVTPLPFFSYRSMRPRPIEKP